MDSQTHLIFASQTSKKKPETISNKDNACPFCRVSDLDNIIASNGPVILLKNKFQTLKDSLQTVLIETNNCHSDISNYNKEHLYEVIRFAVTNWLYFESKKEYKSVILFKNHGLLSGGTIRHPHMQIVGLNKIDYMKAINIDFFNGIQIYKCKEIEFNISTKPKMGFYELNIVLNDINYINKFADCIQTSTNFFLNHFHFKCDSYNLFFYKLGNVLACKVIPRFVTSPIYVGYSIPQVPDDIEIVANKVKNYVYI